MSDLKKKCPHCGEDHEDGQECPCKECMKDEKFLKASTLEELLKIVTID